MFLADMHTHSENSHDSVCKIEDMFLSQLEKGTQIMAATDHFDTFAFDSYDIFTPIKNSFETVQKLNDKYRDKGLILTGIELGEGFWHPDICKKALNLVDYDVVIGSVHSVKQKNLTAPFSVLSFKDSPEEELYAYINAYFDDMITMINFMDFDILAHLTIPLRYLNGKFHRDIKLAPFREKIQKILSLIIEKGIALEVNTSTFDFLGDFLPSREIIKEYYNMGGRLITLGSDAHTKENASFRFPEAIKALKEIGFESIYYYKNRKPQVINLTETPHHN